MWGCKIIGDSQESDVIDMPIHEEGTKLDPCILVIFGATGDLARRKLFPALYNLYRQQQLPGRFAVIGLGRKLSDESEFRDRVCHSVREFSRKVEDGACGEFLEYFKYQRFEIEDPKAYAGLKQLLEETDRALGTGGNFIFYLAVAPEQFAQIVERLSHERLAEAEIGWRRIVIEKPFGKDLESARQLNRRITRVFNEDEIYRIDHYLGKEMIQNIMIIRFANSLFEPLWNNRYIDNVQISVTEADGVGARGRYYEGAGAVRDMVQNHLMQLLTLTAMEAPVDLTTRSIRDEKVKVIRSLRRFSPDMAREFIVRGQYGPGSIDGRRVKGYREEEGVSSDSMTETFLAAKLFIDNFRWSGVPFYLRTGKRLPRSAASIVIEFKAPAGVLYFEKYGELLPNVLVIKIQPEEGVYLRFNAKELGMRDRIIPVKMDYCQNCIYPENSPEAYERLIRDVISGDSALFTRWDEVENAWAFTETITDAWKGQEVSFPNYAAGTWGPKEAEDLLRRDGKEWWSS